jgi:hypothetical protein
MSASLEQFDRELHQIALRNQLNATHSTGPRTVLGKARSSGNALKHGLTSTKVVLPGEDQAEFDRMHQSLIAELKPEGEFEAQLVADIANCVWRLGRARAIETDRLLHSHDLFTSDNAHAKGFDRILRYTASIERQLNRAHTQLRQLQSDRRKQQFQEPAKPKALAAAASPAPESGFVLSKPQQPAGIRIGDAPSKLGKPELAAKSAPRNIRTRIS